MAGINKLNRVSDQRKAILRSQVTALIWNGKIETTDARAKEVRRIAEKLITKAIRQYDNTVTVTKSVKDSNGNVVSVDFVNDAPAKLAVRRQLMAYLYDVPEAKLESINTLSARRITNIRSLRSSSERLLPSMTSVLRNLARAAVILAYLRWARGAATRLKW